jgi:hypothetical protein
MVKLWHHIREFYVLLILILVGLLVILFVIRQPLINAIDVQWVLINQTAPDIGYNAPSKLFKIIKDNPKDENVWKALHHYSSLTDAGATLMFYDDCFHALKENPLLFFNRYMAGDEQALFRMVDALSHDFSAFSGESFQETDRVFQQSFNSIMEFRTAHSQKREAYRRAYDFDRISEAQYVSWKLRYCELTKENSDIVAKNCATWEK